MPYKQKGLKIAGIFLYLQSVYDVYYVNQVNCITVMRDHKGDGLVVLVLCRKGWCHSQPGHTGQRWGGYVAVSILVCPVSSPCAISLLTSQCHSEDPMSTKERVR